MTTRLLTGDCVKRMRELDDQSLDAVVTDPPYGIGFMGREWDSFAPAAVAARAESIRRKGTTRSSERWPERVGHGSQGGGVAIVYDETNRGNLAFQEWCEEWASECLRLLKPGGHLVSFGGTRTYHRLAAGVEDAGFEIRDTLAWLFGEGFPKSKNLGGGRGTNLKPGYEPIVLARRPSQTRSIAENVELHGTGGLNIDDCRIPVVDVDQYQRNHSGDRGHARTRDLGDRGATDLRMGGGTAAGARWPANVLLDEAAAQLLDDQTGVLKSGANPTRRGADKFRDVYGDFAGQAECEPARDAGGPSRFYYCAKTSRAERDAGLSGFQAQTTDDGRLAPTDSAYLRAELERLNLHPTVKPIALMRWLCRLVTPAGGVVLDPFLGSGTTGCAAALEGFRFVGIEGEAEYMRIAEARIAFWREHGDDGLRIVAEREAGERARAERRDAGQLDLLDGA